MLHYRSYIYCKTAINEIYLMCQTQMLLLGLHEATAHLAVFTSPIYWTANNVHIKVQLNWKNSNRGLLPYVRHIFNSMWNTSRTVNNFRCNYFCHLATAASKKMKAVFPIISVNNSNNFIIILLPYIQCQNVRLLFYCAANCVLVMYVCRVMGTPV